MTWNPQENLFQERNDSFKESVNCFSRRRLMPFCSVQLLLVHIVS